MTCKITSFTENDFVVDYTEVFRENDDSLIRFSYQRSYSLFVE